MAGNTIQFEKPAFSSGFQTTRLLPKGQIQNRGNAFRHFEFDVSILMPFNLTITLLNRTQQSSQTPRTSCNRQVLAGICETCLNTATEETTFQNC